MRNDYRLFLPVLLVWGCTALVLHQSEEFFQAMLASAAVVCGIALITVASVWRRPCRGSGKSIPVTLMLLLLTSAMLSAVLMRVGVEHELRHPALLRQAVQEGAAVTLQATVTSSAVAERSQFDDAPQFWVTAVVSQVSARGGSQSAAIPVRLSASASELEGVGIGSSVEATGAFVPVEQAQSIAYRVAVSDVRSTSPPAVLVWAETLRSTLRAEAQHLSGWGAQLIPGLAVGDTTLVTNTLDTAMKSASLTHLTAVSGANCAIITGLIMLIGRKLRFRVWLRVGLALLFLILFVVLVTPEPSVLRAAVMSLLALISLLSSRKAIGTAALAVAMLVLLLLDPWQATHFGFILSVLATAGIILFTQPLADLMKRWLPQWLALVIAVPVAAQLTCQPAIVLLQPTLPVLGVVANVLAAPAAPVATVIGLVACILLPLWPLAGAFATWLTWIPASWIALIAAVIHNLPLAQLPWIQGWFGVIVLAAIVTVTLIALLLPKILPPGALLAQLELVRLPVIALALSVLSAIAIVHPWATRSALPPHWRLFVCDVGQGDAVIVRGSAGVMLIDTGIDPELITRCLDEAAVPQIDVLVLTHDDADHVGGASGVFDRTTRAVISPSSEPQGERKILKELARGGVPSQIASAGMTGSLGDVTWRVLWPTQRATLENRNDASVVIRVETPEFSSLFLGDLGEDAQRSLLASQLLPPVDVVKVSHHGSSDQFSELYQRASATFGILSVGANNGYGHPTATALELLREADTTVLRTDVLGAFAFARNPDGEWVVWRSAALG